MLRPQRSDAVHQADDTSRKLLKSPSISPRGGAAGIAISGTMHPLLLAGAMVFVFAGGLFLGVSLGPGSSAPSHGSHSLSSATYSEHQREMLAGTLNIGTTTCADIPGPICGDWKNQGNCADGYMSGGKSIKDELCPVTCGGACSKNGNGGGDSSGGTPGCADIPGRVCGDWKANNLCGAFSGGKSIMDELCPVTCGGACTKNGGGPTDPCANVAACKSCPNNGKCDASCQCPVIPPVNPPVDPCANVAACKSCPNNGKCDAQCKCPAAPKPCADVPACNAPVSLGGCLCDAACKCPSNGGGGGTGNCVDIPGRVCADWKANNLCGAFSGGKSIMDELCPVTCGGACTKNGGGPTDPCASVAACKSCPNNGKCDASCKCPGGGDSVDGCTSVPNFNVVKGVNHFGDDIGQVTGALASTPTGIGFACMSDSKCVAFDSAGNLKSATGPRGDSTTCFYTKSSVVGQITGTNNPKCTRCNIPVAQGGCVCNDDCTCKDGSNSGGGPTDPCANVPACKSCPNNGKCDAQCQCPVIPPVNPPVDPCANVAACKSCQCDAQCKCPPVAAITGSCPDWSAALEVHNSLRRGRNTPEVTYNDVMAAEATAWSQSLVSDAGCRMDHSTSAQRNGDGENIYTASAFPNPPAISCVAASNAWAAEAKDYVMSATPFTTNDAISKANPNIQTGHFTQMAWKATTQIGCGAAQSVVARCVVVTCRYRVAGNMITDDAYRQNVLPVN